MFLIGLSSLCVSTYLNLMSGVCSGFGGNENIIRIQGMGMSGLLTNVVALVCTVFSEYINPRYIFLIYLLVGDLGVFYFLCLKLKFIRWDKDQKLRQNLALKAGEEGLLGDHDAGIDTPDFKAKKQVTFELQDLSPGSKNDPKNGTQNDQTNDSNNAKTKVINPFENSGKTEESRDLITIANDIEIKTYNKPLEYSQNLLLLWDLYLNLFLCYWSTLGSFPTIIFRFDLSDVVSFRYKFISLTFIFNLGDIMGRYLIDCVKVPRSMLHFLTVGKILVFYVCYLCSVSSAGSIYFAPLFKYGMVFLTSLLNGYNPTLCFLLGMKTFPGNEVDRVRVGHIYQWTIQVGLLSGAAFAALVF